MRRVLIMCLLAASTAVLAAPAAAHGPQASSPAPGSEVGRVDRIELLFAEPMSFEGMFITVTDERGAAIPSRGSARLDETTRLAFVEIEPITAPGVYRVDYRVAGQDGVTTPGAYLFTVAPAAPPPPSLESTAAATSPDGFPWVALALGIGVAAVLVVRFGRRAWRRW